MEGLDCFQVSLCLKSMLHSLCCTKLLKIGLYRNWRRILVWSRFTKDLTFYIFGKQCRNLASYLRIDLKPSPLLSFVQYLDLPFKRRETIPDIAEREKIRIRKEEFTRKVF